MKLCTSVDDAEWEQLLRSDPRAHVAQRPSFLRALAGTRARWLETRDERGELRAGLGFEERTKGPLCMRVSGVGGTYGGPVAAPADDQAEALLAHRFSDRSPRLVHLEMVWAGSQPPRGSWPGLQPLPTAELPIDPKRHFEHFLDDVFGRKGRKECNRSERRGLRARRETDARAWFDFSAALQARAVGWGVHLPPAGVIEQLLTEHEEVDLFAVRDQHDAVLGVHLVLNLPGELFAWIGSSSRVAGANPATLLLREEARHAHARGLLRVNLGSSLGLGGVHQYKQMLGAVESMRWIVRWQPWWRRLRPGRNPIGER